MLKTNTLRPEFHFTARKGWINDPNGLVFFKEQYHLFYQYNPYHCNWDSMHWGHAVSDDLLLWREKPAALVPDHDYDNHPEGGCFSGSVIIKNDRLYVFYTGSVKDSRGQTVQSQCMAWSDDGIVFHKADQPVIPSPPEPGVTDFRDPKVFLHDGKYYMLIGASLGGADNNGDGRLYLYRSGDLSSWEYCGAPLVSEGKMGTMFECPDMFMLEDKWIITFSPMYHPHWYQTMYLIGEMDFEQCRFTACSEGRPDLGPDYYAMQTYPLPDGNKVALAWQNGWRWMPWFDGWGPTEREGWRGTLSLPRRCFINDSGMLCTAPCMELLAISAVNKQETVMLDTALTPSVTSIATGACFLADIPLDADITGQSGLYISLTSKDQPLLVLTLEPESEQICITRPSDAHPFSASLNVPGKDVQHLCLFFDGCNATVWLGQTSTCATFNVYPSSEQCCLELKAIQGCVSLSNLTLTEYRRS